MSLEVFGDEGDVPTRWEDTAMRQEFDEVVNRWTAWRRKFQNDTMNDEGKNSMSRYPNEDAERFDQQFAETETERNERLAAARKRRALLHDWRFCPHCGHFHPPDGMCV